MTPALPAVVASIPSCATLRTHEACTLHGREVPECREVTADSDSSGWEQYDGHVDHLLGGSADVRLDAFAPITVGSAAAELDVAPAAGVPAVEPQPAASVVLLCDSSDGSDWDDDNIMMTLSDGVREHVAGVQPHLKPRMTGTKANLLLQCDTVEHRSWTAVTFAACLAAQR